MAKAREDLVKEKHQLKEELGMVEMRLDGANEQNKALAESKATLEQSLHRFVTMITVFGFRYYVVVRK